MDSTVVFESLKELGYTPVPSSSVIKSGLANSDFRQIVLYLSNEIHVLGETEERLTNGDDLNVLRIELSSLLNELNCPYDELVSGNLTTRFDNGQLLLGYLIGELMSLQMYRCNKQADTRSVIELQETPTATALKDMASALGMGTPPSTLSSPDLFNRLNTRIDEILKKSGWNRIGKPLLSPAKTWSDKQWVDLEKRHAELDKEYDLRREMLLTRLDCTVQAFNWSERMKHKQNEIFEKYRAKLSILEKMVKGGASTDIVALLAARDLLLAIEKASSAAVVKNTKSKIQRHIIGQVPDRGGRAWEHAPPPPEMPSWQKQRATGNRGGGNNFRQQHNNNPGRGNFQQQSNRGSRGGGYAQRDGNDQYDSNRGGGTRVQSGWSQRGHGQHRGRGRGGGGSNNYRGGPY